MDTSIPSSAEPLADLRRAIDALDDQLLELLAVRHELALRARPLKERAGRPIQDLGREAEIVRRAAEAARARGLDPEPVRDIFWRLVELGRAAQGSATERAR